MPFDAPANTPIFHMPWIYLPPRLTKNVMLIGGEMDLVRCVKMSKAKVNSEHLLNVLEYEDNLSSMSGTSALLCVGICTLKADT